MSAAVRIRVPATSANLGPGFDCAGLALGLYDEVVVAPWAEGLHVQVSGEGAGALPLDGSHLVVAALRRTVERLGGRPAGVHLRAHNAVPQGRGLGSSAAAVVAGVLAGSMLVRGHAGKSEELLDLAADLEGHPDNVAAALYGNLTLARTDRDGHRHAVVVEPDRELAPAVFVPPTRLATDAARGLLPATVPHADAAANAAAAALLVPALTDRPDLLMAATEDRLHQEYRRPAMPASLELVDRLRAAGIPAAVSGSGPSVLALSSRGVAVPLAAYCPPGWRILELPVDRFGATVSLDPTA